MKRTVVILAAGMGTRISAFRNDVPKPLVRICGLPLIERAIRSAARAGFNDFVVITGYKGNEVRDYLKDGRQWGVDVRYADNPDWKLANGVSLLKAKEVVQNEFVLLMSDHLVDAKIFPKLAELSLREDDLVLVTDPRIEEIYDLDDATKVRAEGDRIVAIGKNLDSFNTIDTGIFLCSTKVFDVLEEAFRVKGDVSLSEGVKKLAEVGKARVEEIGSHWWQDVDAEGAYKHAEKLLIQSQRKPTDVWVSRNFNRPISLFFSKYLSRTSMTPDMVSILGTAVGFMSPLFLIQGHYLGFVLGAFFYHFSSVLDGCDGELARLKFMESKRGEWVDTIADTISHVLFVAGLTIGLYHAHQSHFFIFLGVLAFFGMATLLYVMFQYLVKVAHKGTLIAFEQDYVQAVAPNQDFSTRLARALKPLIRRATFAFMFWIMAIVGKPEWILYLIAFGLNLATGLVYITFRKRLREMATETSSF